MRRFINRFRSSLALKWMFTLLFTGLFGVGLVWFFANQTTNIGFDQLKLEQAQADFSAAAQTYYEAHGSWDGVRDAMEPKKPDNQTPKDGMFGGPPPLQFILADETNTMIICTPPNQIGNTLTSDQITKGTPIVVNDKRVGTALIAQGTPTLNPLEQRYLSRINQGLVLGAVGAALIAILVGLLLTRHFMRPLRDLTLALGEMRGGKLEQQVPVRSQDELGALTRTFNQMSKDLVRANYLRKQMTADIAHDLRTPLTVIAGYLEGLQDGTLKPTAQRFETMNGEVVRLKRLVEDLRTLSLADAGELKLTYQRVPVADLLSRVAASFQPLFDEAGLSLTVQVAPDLPDLNIDCGRVEQVLGNLVSNSMRHTPSGGSVTLSAALVAGAVHVSVQDTGEGIPADKLPYIFERLYRVDQARSSEEDSGLGLAIVKSIVEAHESTVAARSEVGKGTTVTIQFTPKLALPGAA